jgi:CheY-like chemotaxis protein
MSKILIIDDYREVAEMMEMNLNAQLPGVEIHIAEDGVIGYGKCCLLKYDVIITDYKMPGINGIKSSKFIKESKLSLNKETPLILISAFIPQLEDRTTLDFATHILAKPFKFLTLVDLVQSAIEENKVA